MSDAGLKWGQLDCLADPYDPTLPYLIEMSGDGSDWGNPEAVIAAIQSRLQDGSLGSINSYGNRTATVHLRVKAGTYDALGAAEDALVAETRRTGYNTLAWTPSKALAAWSVFDVIYSTLNWTFDDLSEPELERHYVANLTCLPFPRSATEVVASALPTPPPVPTTATIDNGSSVSGWTGSWSVDGAAQTTGAPASSGGAVRFTTDPTGGPVGIYLKRTGTVDTSTMRYIVVDWALDHPYGGSSYPANIVAEMASTTKVAEYPSPTAGFTRSWFRVAVASVPYLAFAVAAYVNLIPYGGTARFSIDNIFQTDAAPAGGGTARQLVRTIPVDGSVRSQAQLSVQHETSSLGEVLVYAYADDGSGYVPALRPSYFNGGTVTPDTALVSGARNMLDTPAEFRVAAAALPAGSHQLYARLRGSSAGTVTLNVTAVTIIGTATQADAVTVPVTLTVGTAWAIFDLAGFALPGTLLANPASASVSITIADSDTAGIDVDLDEAWLFNLDVGALTHVDCGTGTPAAGGSSNRLWLDPATVTNDGQDAVYVGTAAGRQDARFPAGLKGWSPPTFEPPAAKVFTVTTNAENAAVELRHFPRFAHNVRAVA